MIKKNYNLGDSVWIHGINRNNGLVKGEVVKIFTIDDNYFDPNTNYYVIAIPTHIEPLLEVRVWETMSQDENGPVGMFRDLKEHLDATNKTLAQSGYYYDDSTEDPLPEEINASIDQLEKQSRTDTIFKPPKKPRFRNRKAKKNHVNNS